MDVVVSGISIIRLVKVRYCIRQGNASPVGTASGSEILSRTDPSGLFPARVRISVLCKG
jgi:hypothetical protein